jgi:SAM-dependent methyltransferase
MTDDPDYASKVAAQIAQFAQTVNMHELPNSFHIWAHYYMFPPLAEIFGAKTIDDIYISSFIEAMAGVKAGGRILSIGCGYGDLEIRIAKALVAQGWRDVVIDCADISPVLIERVAADAAKQSVARNINPLVADLNAIDLPHRYDMIMANHSLHHIVGLERLFDFSFDHLADNGLFATVDVIGRNGHMRWPETAAFIKALWGILDEKKKYHVLLSRFSETFLDHDCSTEGFEGIRAQDILPLMLKKFRPYKFYAAGGIADLVFDRGYGHGFDVEKDKELIHFICQLNELLLDADVIKPTTMMASFSRTNRGEICYRDRRAAKCVRNPAAPPDWTRYYEPSA